MKKPQAVAGALQKPLHAPFQGAICARESARRSFNWRADLESGDGSSLAESQGGELGRPKFFVQAGKGTRKGGEAGTAGQG